MLDLQVAAQAGALGSLANRQYFFDLAAAWKQDYPNIQHYPPAGYTEIAHLICPLVERDNYGKVFTNSITPGNLFTRLEHIK